MTIHALPHPQPMTWFEWMLPLISASSSLRQNANYICDAVHTAFGKDQQSGREVYLEEALRTIEAARRDLDEIELLTAQALAAAKAGNL